MNDIVTAPRLSTLAQWLEQQSRPVTRAELLSQWSTWSLDAALRHGTVVRMLPGIYAGPSHASASLVRAQAVSLWSCRAVISGSSALHLYHQEFSAPATVDIVLPYGSRVRAPSWVRVREQRPVNAWRELQRVRCVAPEIALLDAWHREPRHVGKDFVYRALWQRVCTPRQLARALTTAPRVAGRRDLGAILSYFQTGATSPLEVMARREVFAGAQFGEFVWQATLMVAGRQRRPDLLHRRARVVVELDGSRYHSGANASARDRLLDIEMAAAGFTTLRLGFRDVRDRPQWCRAVVWQAVQARL